MYKGSVSNPAGPVGGPIPCTFEGGHLIITKPDGSQADATPEGGIPRVGSDLTVASLPIEYTVTPEDAAKGNLFASMSYIGVVAHTSTSDETNVPVLSTAVITAIQPCPLVPNAPCVTFLCDPGLTSGDRTGVCSDQTGFVPQGAPCPDTDGDPCTIARCDGAGTCDQNPGAPCDDNDACTMDMCVPGARGMECQHTRIPGCPPCGDAVVESGEQCDEGPKNGAVDSCCDTNCKLRRTTYICRFAASACQEDSTCQASTGPCPENQPTPSDRICNDGDACTIGDHCDGLAGVCVSTGKLCGATAAVRSSHGGAFPRLRIDCMGIPILRGRGAFCAATAFATPDITRGHACRPDDSGRIPITNVRRRAFKTGSLTLLLPLNPCGRKFYRSLAAGANMRATVEINLGGIVTADANQRSAMLNSVVPIPKR